VEFVSGAAKQQDVRPAARQLLRQWLGSSEAEALSSVDALGRSAIRAAAQAAERLDRGTAMAASADGVLHELQMLAEAYAPAEPPRRRLRLFPRAQAERPVRPDLNALVAKLERERDNVAHGLITIDTDRSRLQDSEAGLEEAIQLIRACAVAIEAAARELAGDRPERAGFLRDGIAPRLLAREQDVLTQLAVTRQGVLALQLVSDGQRALGQAIDRARETSVAALRTAMAARQAVDGSRDLLQQADALDRTMDAARGTGAADRDVDRAVADAVDQVRRAIDAANLSARPL
jgi:uncharacterized protein YaaN involved in tellurite resistance